MEGFVQVGRTLHEPRRRREGEKRCLLLRCPQAFEATLKAAAVKAPMLSVGRPRRKRRCHGIEGDAPHRIGSAPILPATKLCYLLRVCFVGSEFVRLRR